MRFALWSPFWIESWSWGGVARRLHALQADPDFVPLTTVDVDLAVHTEGHGPDLLEAFRTARFRETLRGAEHPPSRIYETDGSEYVQFIANRHGGAGGRTGERPAIVEFHGLYAEALPFVDVLLRSPWTAHVGSGPDALEVQVVNPAAFVLQKGLIFNSRAPADQAKDVLYVHDTFTLFDPSELEDAAVEIWDSMSVKRRRAVRQWASVVFAKQHDAVFGAANIASAANRNAPPTGDEIAAQCRAGMELKLSISIS